MPNGIEYYINLNQSYKNNIYTSIKISIHQSKCYGTSRNKSFIFTRIFYYRTLNTTINNMYEKKNPVIRYFMSPKKQKLKEKVKKKKDRISWQCSMTGRK